MGTLFIVAGSEGVEGPLLAHCTTGFGWVSRILLQRPVKSLQSPILLRVTRLDTLRCDSQLDPPYRQGRESPKADAGKWRAVVCAYSPGQAILSKHSPERSAHLWPRRSSQTTACQEVPGAASWTVRGSMRIPSPVRNQPLKSMHHTSLASMASVNGWLHGEVRLRLCRRLTSPTRLRISPTVLDAGQHSWGTWARSQATTFFGPQVG